MIDNDNLSWVEEQFRSAFCSEYEKLVKTQHKLCRRDSSIASKDIPHRREKHLESPKRERLADYFSENDLSYLSSDGIKNIGKSHANIAVYKQNNAVFNRLWSTNEGQAFALESLDVPAKLLRKAKRRLMKVSIEEEIAMRVSSEHIIIVSSEALEQTLSTIDTNSFDYTAFKIVVDAPCTEVPLAFGFKWFKMIARPNLSRSVAYHRNNVKLFTSTPVNSLRFSASKNDYVFNTSYYQEVEIKLPERIIRLLV